MQLLEGWFLVFFDIMVHKYVAQAGNVDILLFVKDLFFKLKSGYFSSE